MYNYAKNIFEKYIKDNYDIDNEKISHKLNHTYHVVENARIIATDMDLDKENINLAMVIALFHDIGRFEQVLDKNSFREDIIKYDHAALGVKLLFEDDLIRKFIKDDKYDDVIRTAILNHSKYILDPSNMTDIEILHSKIIRDADKVDSFRAKSEEDIYTMANITKEDIENSYITDKIYNDFMEEKTIISKDRKTGIDIWISYIAFVFGLEFSSSLKIIKDKDYINKLFDRFDYKYEKERMFILRDKALTYIEKKV